MLFPSQIVTKWLVIDFLLAVEISRHLTGLSVGDDMVHLHLDQEEPESFLSGSDQFGVLGEASQQVLGCDDYVPKLDEEYLG